MLKTTAAAMVMTVGSVKTSFISRYLEYCSIQESCGIIWSGIRKGIVSAMPKVIASRELARISTQEKIRNGCGCGWLTCSRNRQVKSTGGSANGSQRMAFSINSSMLLAFNGSTLPSPFRTAVFLLIFPLPGKLWS